MTQPLPSHPCSRQNACLSNQSLSRPSSLSFTVHDITLDKITAAWLLPPVAAISSSSAGAVIAGSFPNPNHALITLVTSYVIWGFSVPLGFIVIAVYFQRLIFHKIVPDIALASSIVPIGPLGQAAYG